MTIVWGDRFVIGCGLLPKYLRVPRFDPWLQANDSRNFFEENGFLHVKQAVGAEQLARLRQACDRVDAEHRAQQQLAPDARLNLLDFIGLDDEFLELLDCPKTFPKVWGIMGWHISLCARSPRPTPRVRGAG